MCDTRGSRDVSDVSRRPAAPVHVPAKVPNVNPMQPLATWAQNLARTLLADPLPRRWAHVQGVAARARALAPALGARHLRDAHRADDMLCRLVAHHSCAVIEAEERGLADTLTREFPPPRSTWPTR